MKILYYNWAPYDNQNNIGGGVTIYLRNLINYLTQNKNNEIYVLSGGYKYNPFFTKTYIQKSKKTHCQKCKSFEIINSPIVAPQFLMFYNIEKYLSDSITVKLFDNFIKKYGPFDIIHIQNFEGISINVLKLKEKYPNTKFIYSVHNYQMICPLVQYFQNNKECVCNNFNHGQECSQCINAKIHLNTYSNRVYEYLKDIISSNYQFINILLKNVAKIISLFECRKYIIKKNHKQSSSIYEQYRKTNIKYLNQYCDKIIAVSKRVEDIMIEHGINNNKIETLYIGTKIAKVQKGQCNTQQINPFVIAYLGYARVDKGFWFLLNSLKKLPQQIQNQIGLVFAVKGYKPNDKWLNHFAFTKTYDGYTHQELKEILSNVNLGIIPVLWEDNLPQVAIEMVANGVPILCSSFGGASELCDNQNFKFIGGDVDDFINKLVNIINNPKILNDYWKNHSGLKTMEQHINELFKVYNEE